MASGSIHYEVFFRRGKAAGWELQGAYSTRDIAVAEAKNVLVENPAAGVRVFKETFKPESGEYMTLKVHEEGDVSEQKGKKAAGATTSLPCFKPDDLYSFHGKRTIARLLRDALSRWRITTTELLHHPGHIERLEMTATVLQGAVQKAAVKHAGATGEPVQEIMKQLNDIVSRAIARVVMDNRGNKLPKIGADGFGALCIKVQTTSTPSYFLNAAIAAYLEDVKSWGEKLSKTITLLNELPSEEAPRKLGLETVDSLVAEMLEGNAALGDLLGEQPDLGAALLKLADLFLGRLDASKEKPGVQLLLAEFAKGNLVNARAAIAQRVLAEIRGVRRLRPESLDEEVKLIRMLATRMAMGQGSLVSHEEIMEAFIARSKQLVMPSAVERYLEGLKKPEDKIEKIFQLEENVIGVANKRELISFIMGVLGSPRTETYFLESAEPAMARLGVLAQMYKRAARSGLQRDAKAPIFERIDALALALDQKLGVLDSTMRQAPSPLDAAERLIALITGDVLPEGALADAARTRVRDMIRNPAFKAAVAGQPPERLAAFTHNLAKAGLDVAGKADAA